MYIMEPLLIKIKRTTWVNDMLIDGPWPGMVARDPRIYIIWDINSSN